MTKLSRISGQAKFRQLRSWLLLQQLDLHTQMVELVEESRVSGCPLFLQRHVVVSQGRKPGHWVLRWRLTIFGQHKHTRWCDVQEIVSELPLAIAKHAQYINRRMDELNLLDSMVQMQISRIDQFLGTRADSAVHSHNRVAQQSLALEVAAP